MWDAVVGVHAQIIIGRRVISDGFPNGYDLDRVNNLWIVLMLFEGLDHYNGRLEAGANGHLMAIYRGLHQTIYVRFMCLAIATLTSECVRNDVFQPL